MKFRRIRNELTKCVRDKGRYSAERNTSSHRFFYSKLKNCIIISIFLLFLFQFTSIRSVTKQKQKKREIIIKLIQKNVHALTHTETSHPGCIWATVLWVPCSALGGSGAQRRHPRNPSPPRLDPTAPVLPGGVWVCCVRLVGVRVREGLMVGEGGLRITEFIAPSEERATQSKDGHSAPDPPES